MTGYTSSRSNTSSSSLSTRNIIIIQLSDTQLYKRYTYLVSTWIG